jgi:2-polyprenyl-6-methoxyphenol hydroxylase-like FAD-dependent oxidoreductase
LIRSALQGCRTPASLSVCDARGSYAGRGGGVSWLAIGDARIAPDPLSGQGIHWAIDDACSVFELMKGSRWREITDEMLSRTVREVARYRTDRQLAYSGERRFDSDAYWTTQASL